MKKILSLVLSLVLLSVPALAENTAETLTYAHPTAGYGFDYPADMVLISGENYQELADRMAGGEQVVDGLTAEGMVAQGEALAQQDMVMVMTANGMLNMTVSYVDLGVGMTDAEVLLNYCPLMLEEYQAIYPDCEVLDEGSLDFAGYKTVTTQKLHIDNNGIGMTVQVIYDINGTYLYSFAVVVVDYLLSTDEAYAESVVDIITSSLKYTDPVTQ